VFLSDVRLATIVWYACVFVRFRLATIAWNFVLLSDLRIATIVWYLSVFVRFRLATIVWYF
jgi:hypothetical protein